MKYKIMVCSLNTKKIIEEKPILLLLIPALASFLIALVTTLKYQWPLDGDIFYHVTGQAIFRAGI
jgi:hypothetical protein